MSEAFLKKNCGPGIEIIENDINYAEGDWNMGYGDVIIDPVKYPNAIYKWEFQLGNKGGFNTRLGIASIWKEMTSPVFFEKDTPSYAHCCQNSIFDGNGYSYISGQDSDYFKHVEKHQYDDVILIIIQVSEKKISFYKNNIFMWKCTIDTTVKYKSAIQFSGSNVIFNEYRCIQDSVKLVSGYIRALYQVSGVEYVDIINIVRKYCSFFV